VRAILFSQVPNGVLLPVILYLIVSLASRRDLMGKWANRRYQTSIAWVAVVALLVLSAAMTAVSLTNGM
jgi:Mn2+/Fe2+ NRAMP family transporter